MLAQQSASRSVRRKRIDLDPRRLFWTVGECARAMGVSYKTARRKLTDCNALQRIGGWDYTSRELIRQGFGRLAPGLIAALEAGDDDES